jgi:ribosomal protein L23
MDVDIHIPYPEKLSFNNIDELYDYVDQINYTKLQGVIVFAPDNQQFKILNKRYHQYYLVRGNEPSIKFRYLQVRMDQTNYNILRELYPEKVKDFEDYENYIFEASKNIYKAYIDRFIKKLYVTVPVEEYNVIKEAHNWYLNDRKNNKITYEKIMTILNNQNPTNLNKIIKRVKLGTNLITSTSAPTKNTKLLSQNKNSNKEEKIKEEV